MASWTTVWDHNWLDCCALSTGTEVDVSGCSCSPASLVGIRRLGTDSDKCLLKPVFDNKRNLWLATLKHCAGALAADTSHGTHVRLFINVANAPAVSSARLGTLSLLDSFSR